MKINLLNLILTLTFLIISGTGCKAPRNNPSDPLNPDYNFGSIEGFVQSIGIPSFGISDVTVLWQNDNLITQTNSLGRFRIDGIPIRDGKIIFSKNGYKSDTLEVVWGSSKGFFTQVFFNRIPTLDTVSIYTSLIGQSGLDPISTLSVKAWIMDLDDDIDTVFVMNETLALKKPLLFSDGERNFQTTVSSNEMGNSNIEETIGLDFSIIVKDKFQNIFELGKERITRVIKDEITGLYPSGDSTVSINSQPVILYWDKFAGGYSCNYMIEIYKRDLLSSQLIHTVNNIEFSSTSYTLPFNLEEGDYYWTIWVIDKFQNRSRSKPVLFQIE